MRFGTPGQRLRDQKRVSVPEARILALGERGQEQAIEVAQVDAAAAQTTVDGALAGTEAFTGLLVGSTDVKPFLDKTDGSKLTNSTGLGGDVVTTPALNTGAANQVLSVHSFASIAVPAATDTVVQTLVVTTVAGETVDLAGQFNHLEMTSAAGKPTIVGTWYRNGVALVPATNVNGLDITRVADASRYALGLGAVTVPAVDAPGAGTHTYTLVAYFNQAGNVYARYGRILTATRP